MDDIFPYPFLFITNTITITDTHHQSPAAQSPGTQANPKAHDPAPQGSIDYGRTQADPKAHDSAPQGSIDYLSK